MGSVCFLKMQALQEIPVNCGLNYNIAIRYPRKNIVQQLKEQDTLLQYLKY